MRYSLSLISFGRPIIIALTPFSHPRRARGGEGLFSRQTYALVTICLHDAEYLLAALVVLQACVGAFLQHPVSRLHYLFLRWDVVAESRRSLARLQTDGQKTLCR